jgi:agmatine deiminase
MWQSSGLFCFCLSGCAALEKLFSFVLALALWHWRRMSNTSISVPPEWAPHDAIWAGWPHIRGEWGEPFEDARAQITVFLKELCKVTLVKVACGSREAYGSAFAAFEPEIEAGDISLHTLPTGDIWLRDTGPIFARVSGAPNALTFKFNGWGGKYMMPGDTMTAGAIAGVEQVSACGHDFILEGGAIDLDGAGRLLTTRQCVLNPNRNAHWDEVAAEAALKAAFGVSQVIWLGDGLANDHTDGHVDNIARFIGESRAVCQSFSGADDPNADTLTAIEADLRAAGIEVVTIPSPGLILDEDGEAIPASHMNFLISNGHVFLPVYNDVYSQAAIAALGAALPDHVIVPVYARAILSGGGSLHCMTQQVPAF